MAGKFFANPTTGQKAMAKPVEIMVFVIIAIIVMSIYIFMGTSADYPKTAQEVIEKAPESSLSVANPEDVRVIIEWKGPLEPERPRSLVEKLMGWDKLYKYSVKITNLKLKYRGDKLPLYALHPVLVIQGAEVVDIPEPAQSLKLTKQSIDNGVFEYPDIAVDGISSYRKPATKETSIVANKKPVLYNENVVLLHFWLEDDCFQANKGNIPNKELFKSCCISREQCSWLGSVVLPSTNKLFSSGVIVGKIYYTGSMEFTGAENEAKNLFFEIENTGQISWDSTDGIEINDNIVFAVHGCIGKNERGETVPVVKRYKISKITSKAIAPGEKITSEMLGPIECILPQKKQDVWAELIANCLDSAGSKMCSNSESAVSMDYIRPFIVE